MSSPLNNLPDFSLVSEEVEFEPTYYPERVKPKRKRNIEKEDSFCDGQEIIDNGAQNVGVHVDGYIIDSEKSTFWDALAKGGKYRLISMPWSGFVKIKSGRLEGPIGLDDNEREFVYDYSLKLVSTNQEDKDLGVVEEAETVPDPAKNITYTQIYSQAGFTPSQKDQDYFKNNLNHPFEIYNTIRNDEDSLEMERRHITNLFFSAKELIKKARSKIPKEKGITGVRKPGETVEI